MRSPSAKSVLGDFQGSGVGERAGSKAEREKKSGVRSRPVLKHFRLQGLTRETKSVSVATEGCKKISGQHELNSITAGEEETPKTSGRSGNLPKEK